MILLNKKISFFYPALVLLFVPTIVLGANPKSNSDSNSSPNSNSLPKQESNQQGNSKNNSGAIPSPTTNTSNPDTSKQNQDQGKQKPAPVTGGSPLSALNPPSVPPGGFKIIVNGGSQQTKDQNVSLSFVTGSDVASVSVSNSSDFANSVQIPLKPNVSWDICKGLSQCSEGTHSIYVQFKTSLGQPSDPVSANIIFDKKSNPSSPVEQNKPPVIQPTQPTPTSNQNSANDASHSDNSASDPKKKQLPVSQISNANVSLVKDGGAYFIVSQGKRYAVTDTTILQSRGLEIKDAKPATDADRALQPVGSVSVGEGALVKTSNSSAIYLISEKQKHSFSSLSVFNELGYKTKNVLTISTDDLNAFPLGDSINSSKAAHRTGANILLNGAVYWVSYGVKHLYPNTQVYNSWNKDNDYSGVVPANKADSALPVGDDVIAR